MKISGTIQQRDWIRATGSDLIRFMNGMWTADFKRAESLLSAEAQVTGSALLLQAKGKIVSWSRFLLEGPNSLLLSLPKGMGEKTREALDRLLVADDVELQILNVPPFAGVYEVVDAPPTSKAKPLLSTIPDAKDRLFSVVEEGWGLRLPVHRMGVGHEEFWVHDVELFKSVFTYSDLGNEEYKKLRINHGYAVWGTDFFIDSFPLEFPFKDEISFHKGCYVGQEVVARGTYRGKVTRFLVRFEGVQNLSEDLVYFGAESPLAVGKVTTVSGKRGLGLLRLSAVKESLFQNKGADTVHLAKVEVLGDLTE